MTLALFYAARWDAVAVGSQLELAGDEGNHAVRVKRVRVGERILIGNGRGELATCAVTEIAGKSSLRADVERLDRVPRPHPRVTVVQALVKGERMDRALETLTEAGVDRIVVWQAARSVAKLDRPAAAAEKFEVKVRQAAKQARRAWIPELSVATEVVFDGLVVVLDEEAEVPLDQAVPAGTQADEVTLVVGPEGGFDAGERTRFHAAGARSAAMGPVILRASTAGTVAAGWVMGALGRWQVPPRLDSATLGR